ncbi:MAG: VOC family protein [Firmicutes bacterium]|nr:VOC family protein [Bacillota bacterium]
MGDILGFGHVAVNVKDLEKTRWFYEELLGFPMSEPIPMEGGFSITYATVPGGGQVELFRHVGPIPEHTQRDECTVGLRHLAFIVAGLPSLREKLVAAGVRITLDLTDIPALGVKVLLFEDPNGVTLEFAERTCNQDLL